MLFPGHAYLFEGDLKMWQDELASFLDSFASEDKTIVTPERETGWSIRDIRALTGWTALKPYAGSRKLAILEQVESLTSEGADAFLKTLEEPPPSTVFFLFSRFPRVVPKTIRSRLIVVGTYARVPLPSPEETRSLKELIAMPMASRLKESARYAEETDTLGATLEAWLLALRVSLIEEGGFGSLDTPATVLLMRRILRALRLLRETNAQPRLVLDALFISW
jgi:hypothetical protein